MRGEIWYDGLFKVLELLDVVESTMWDSYTPKCCLTIDQGALAVKGCFSASQYMPSKPLKERTKSVDAV